MQQQWQQWQQQQQQQQWWKSIYIIFRLLHGENCGALRVPNKITRELGKNNNQKALHICICYIV